MPQAQIKGSTYTEPTDYAKLDDPGFIATRSFAPLHAHTHNPAADLASAVPSSRAHGQQPRDGRARAGSYASADLGAEPAAAARARSLTRATLARWDLHHLADDAEAIASESPPTPSKRQSPAGTLPAIIFAIHRGPDELRIIVWDNGPGRPRTAPRSRRRGRPGAGHRRQPQRSQMGGGPPPKRRKAVWAALPAPAAAPDDPAPRLVAHDPPQARAGRLGRPRPHHARHAAPRRARAQRHGTRPHHRLRPAHLRRALRSLIEDGTLVPGPSPNSRLRVASGGRALDPGDALSAALAARRRAARPDPARAGRPRRPLGHRRGARRDRPPGQSRQFWENADRALSARGELLRAHDAYRAATTRARHRHPTPARRPTGPPP